MEHAEEYDLPVVYIVTLKQSRNLPNWISGQQSSDISKCIIA
jgi:hypothetical protein